MDFTPQAFKAILGQFATGVTVVTTCDGERRVGITVNAFTSLSLDPPLILICIERVTMMHDILSRAGVFAVNFLGEEQSDLSVCFATRSDRRYNQFCGASSSVAATGAPILDGTLGYVDCRIVDVFPGGDHSIFIGRVEALSNEDASDARASQGAEQDTGSRESGPLIYYRGGYSRLDGSPS